MKTRTKKHRFEFKPLSWSAMSSFMYDKEQWARKYVDGIIDPPNAQMGFGNVVGQKLASDPTFLPAVPRYAQFEKKLEGKIGEIELIAFLDSFDPETKAFFEYKTSSNKTKWTQKSAEAHGQLDFYFLLLWLNYQIPPEKVRCSLHYIPVHETGDFQMEISKESIKFFEVCKTTKDILKFGAEIKKIYKEMITYADKRIVGKF